MPQENFTTLIPQRGDPPEILRMKHAHAAARAVEPVTVTARVVDNFSFGGVWQQAAGAPTYFRLAYVWGASMAGVNNMGAIRLRYGSNDNRIINPGQMIVIEAPPGLQLNLQDFQYNGGYYYGDHLTWELY
jgi:hypothetical protein